MLVQVLVGHMLIILGGLNHIINLQNHLANLRGQEELLLLATECLKHILFPHVISSDIIAVNAQMWIAFCKLPGLDLSQALNGLQT